MATPSENLATTMVTTTPSEDLTTTMMMGMILARL